ncbi:MAG: GNAT family N-acetyltransferase [Endomicrobia bacterium]|nr:GNAT family N-acetyltransferase [Endomicrobiia bacterium]
MKSIGTRTIETARLILRRVRTEDAEDMFFGWASDDEVTKYMTWKSHLNIEATKSYIDFVLKNLESEDVYEWIIEYKENGKAIGSCGAVGLDKTNEIASIGYCLSKKYWNKGIMSEAVNAVIRYLFDKAEVNRIEAAHHLDNPASGKVMQKCAMKYEGIKKHGMKDSSGSFSDVAVYAVIKSDWKKDKN